MVVKKLLHKNTKAICVNSLQPCDKICRAASSQTFSLHLLDSSLQECGCIRYCDSLSNVYNSYTSTQWSVELTQYLIIQYDDTQCRMWISITLLSTCGNMLMTFCLCFLFSPPPPASRRQPAGAVCWNRTDILHLAATGKIRKWERRSQIKSDYYCHKI